MEGTNLACLTTFCKREVLNVDLEMLWANTKPHHDLSKSMPNGAVS